MDVPSLHIPTGLTYAQEQAMIREWLMRYGAWDYARDEPMGNVSLARNADRSAVVEFLGMVRVRLAPPPPTEC